MDHFRGAGYREIRSFEQIEELRNKLCPSASRHSALLGITNVERTLKNFVEVNPERTVGLDNKDWRGGILGSQRSRGAFSPNRVQYSRTSDLAARRKQRRSIHQGSESRYEPFQGSTTSSPQSPKSATLRVASLARRTRAMAAICASA
jgi:hypothetical protein